MLFFVINVVVLVTASNVEFARGIVDGERTKIEHHPYQVSIFTTIDGSQYFECSGVIISKDYVVTAAYCYTDYKVWNVTVGAGTNIKNGFGGSFHQIASFVRHENYTYDFLSPPLNNIAVIKVKRPFKFDETRRPIKLFEAGEEAKAGAAAVVTGWGFAGDDDPNSDWLRKANVSIIDKDVCKETYQQTGGRKIEGHICTESTLMGGRGPCFKDEGGPLTIDGRLAGIVSSTRSCSWIEDPKLYTDVAYYREWIRKNTNV